VSGLAAVVDAIAVPGHLQDYYKAVMAEMYAEMGPACGVVGVTEAAVVVAAASWEVATGSSMVVVLATAMAVAAGTQQTPGPSSQGGAGQGNGYDAGPSNVLRPRWASPSVHRRRTL